MTDTPVNPADEEAIDKQVEAQLKDSALAELSPEETRDEEAPAPAAETEASAENPPSLTEEELKKKKEDALFWNCLMAIMVLLVVGVGYLVYDQYSKLPDPIQDIKNELVANHAKILEKQAQLKVAQDKCIPKKQLLDILDIQKNTAEQLEETQKSIDNARQRVAGVRGEIRSYYERYRQKARKDARGKRFKIIKTVYSGKTYLNVEIKKVDKSSVSIIHEQGSGVIAASDLPDELRELFAYGDPLNINEMNQSDEALKSPLVNRKKKPAPQPKPAPKKESVIIEDLDPPSGSPRIQTPTQTDENGAQNNGDVWVPPAHAELPAL